MFMQFQEDDDDYLVFHLRVALINTTPRKFLANANGTCTMTVWLDARKKDLDKSSTNRSLSISIHAPSTLKYNYDLRCCCKNIFAQDITGQIKIVVLPTLLHMFRIAQLRDDMLEMLNSPIGADLKIKVHDGTEIEAHTAVLGPRSPVFRTQLTGACKTMKTADVLDWSEYNKQAVQCMLEFLYAAALPPDNLEPPVYLDLCRLAIYLDVPDIGTFSTPYIFGRIHDATALEPVLHFMETCCAQSSDTFTGRIGCALKARFLNKLRASTDLVDILVSGFVRNTKKRPLSDTSLLSI